MITDNKQIGTKPKGFRTEKLMTLQQRAEESGISAGYISKIQPFGKKYPAAVLCPGHHSQRADDRRWGRLCP